MRADRLYPSVPCSRLGGSGWVVVTDALHACTLHPDTPPMLTSIRPSVAGDVLSVLGHLLGENKILEMVKGF